MKVKRRKVNTFDWIALKEIPVSVAEDLKFSIKDLFNAHEEEYEYAIVPVMADGTEGDYLTNKIMSTLNGVFICDEDTILKLYAGVGYGSLTSVIKQGIHESMGNKYPVIVYNSKTDYLIGSVNATILTKEYEDTRKLDRKKFVTEQEKVRQFLGNKRAKIIKDWNGNSWLVILQTNLTLDFNNAIGMAMGNVSAQWIEQGKPDIQSDLYRTGLTKVVE